MSARWSASALALLLFLDALAIAIGVTFALHFDSRHLFGGGGDGEPVSVGVIILGFLLLLALAGGLLAVVIAVVRTPKAGPIAWRSTVIGVLIGFDFGLPPAILCATRSS